MKRAPVIDFGAGRRANVAELEEGDDVEAALAELGVASGLPVLVIVGGAASMESEVRARSLVVLRDAVVPVCEQLGAAVVDGGTAAGVMGVMGDAYEAAHATFPLIGVAAAGTVRVPGNELATGGNVDLDPRHGHFLLVPGGEWGDESPWIVAAARAVAAEARVVALVVGGGDVTATDVRLLAAAGATVIAITGTRGVADELATTEPGTDDSPLADAISWRAVDRLRVVLQRALGSP